MVLNDLKIQELSSRKFYPINSDRLSFASRIKSEHIFNSVDDAIYYLDRIIEFHTIDIDMMASQTFDISNNMTKTLIINTIEESIISIIHEILQQIFREDYEFVDHIRMLISRSKDKIRSHYSLENEDNKIWFYEPLFTILNKIEYLCVFIKSNKEEMFTSDLAISYYNLMICLHSGIDDSYNRDIVDYYKSLIYEMDIEINKFA